MHMNVVSKNIVHSINLDDIWIYDHKYENAWATRENEKKLISRSFQGPISWRKIILHMNFSWVIK